MLLIPKKRERTIFMIKFIVMVDTECPKTRDMTESYTRKCFKFIKTKIYEEKMWKGRKGAIDLDRKGLKLSLERVI